jgi:glycine hydroxymethyltransferase
MNPFPYADVVTSTTHKTLRGPRGGIILTNDEEIIKKINKTIFPGIQGGPLMHVIGAKAQCFYEALQPEFKTYAKNIIKNAKAMSDEFIKNGVKVISGGTDNHLMLIDVKSTFGITGDIAEKTLDDICITVNKNSIPFDTEGPRTTSGLRIGSPAMTTRGFNEKDAKYIVDIICEALRNYDKKEVLHELKKEVLELTNAHPLSKIK